MTDARRLVPLGPRPDLPFAERIAALEAVFPGRIGFLARHLETGVEVELRSDERFGTASVIKVALVAALLEVVRRGEADLDEVIVLPPRRERVTGGGILKHLECDRLSLRDLCELTIVVSDNAATNAVFARCGGAAAVAALFADLGLERSAMPHAVDFARIDHTVDGAIGVSTPRETAALLAALAEGTILDRARCEELLGMLRRQHYQDQIPRWLSWNPYAQWHGRREALEIANKTGELDGIRNDCAVITRQGHGTVAVAIFTDGGTDLRETVDCAGTLAVAECAAAIAAQLLEIDA
jgi:beta-lactamase class A